MGARVLNWQQEVSEARKEIFTFCDYSFPSTLFSLAQAVGDSGNCSQLSR
jgi:hypothetical protein